MSLLFYDRNAGHGELYNTDGQGGINQLKAQFYRTDGQGGITQLSSTNYRKGWALIEWLTLP